MECSLRLLSSRTRTTRINREHYEYIARIPVKILFSTVQDQVGWTRVDEFGPLVFWVCLRPVAMKTRHILEKAVFLQQSPEGERKIKFTKGN